MSRNITSRQVLDKLVHPKNLIKNWSLGEPDWMNVDSRDNIRLGTAHKRGKHALHVLSLQFLKRIQSVTPTIKINRTNLYIFIIAADIFHGVIYQGKR